MEILAFLINIAGKSSVVVAMNNQWPENDMVDDNVLLKIRKEIQAWLSIAGKVDQIIAAITRIVAIDSNDSKGTCLFALFCKIVNSFCATRILVLNGYIQDSGTVLRSLIETLFVLKACAMSDKFYQNYILTDIKCVENVYKKHLRQEMRMKSRENALDGCDITYSDRYKKELEKYNGIAGIEYNIYDAAKTAQLEDFYDIVYVHLCAMNAHTTVRSISKRIIKYNDGKALEFMLGPEMDDANWSMALLIQPMIVALECINAEFSIGLESKIHDVFKIFCEERRKLPITGDEGSQD